MSSQVAQILEQNRQFLEDQGFKYLGLFGSHSRGEETPNSDVDLMYEFADNKTITLFGLARIKRSFEKILGKSVDLVSKKNIKERLKPYINKDLVTIYEER
jgi:hypothetical protein